VTGNAKPADDFVIRPATAADRDFLSSLNDRLIANVSVAGVSRADLQRFQVGYTTAALDGEKPGGETLVAVDMSGVSLGYAHLRPDEDFLTGEPAGYVSILVVRDDAAGRGVGGRLLDAAESWAAARGYKTLQLDVFASNDPARRFYARRGFEEESLRLRRKLGD
jgi:GNAT superfamily N-acetyltransferase